LMESPWAYSVMAITILIDAYLLYIFFHSAKSPIAPTHETTSARVP